MRKIGKFSFIVLGCVLIVGCGKKNYMEQGNSFRISLYDNNSTGYSWSYDISNNDVIGVESYKDYSNCPADTVGCGGSAIYDVKGIKAGKSKMTLKYCFVDSDARSCKTAIYEFIVEDDLNISETHYGTYFDED